MAAKIKAIIVDDEKPSRDVLFNYLNEYCGTDVEVVAMADSVKTAHDVIRLKRPDLVFLDVEMPNGNGFDLLRQLNHVDFRTIFVTAFSEYAVKAFRFYATDYLLKPINAVEVVEAVGKVKKEISQILDNQNIEALLKHSNSKEKDFQRIMLRDMEGFRLIPFTEIIYCEADAYCTNFILTGNRRITSSKNLKHYEDLLTEVGFLRVHNSFLVNLKHVTGYHHEGDIQLIEKHNAPLGNAYKKRFLEHFGH